MKILENDIAKIRWQCKRGMLELDLILLEFFDNKFLRLSAELQSDFIQLLSYPDPVLFAWLMGNSPAADFELSNIIQLINSKNNT